MEKDTNRYEITKEWIQENIAGLSDELVDRVFDAAAAELQMQVGNKLGLQLLDEQVDEFERLIDSGDEDAQLRYLEEVRPDYKEVAEEEVNAIKEQLMVVDSVEAVQALIETWK